METRDNFRDAFNQLSQSSDLVYYIEDLSYSYDRVLISKASLNDTFLIFLGSGSGGTLGINRIYPEYLYGLLLPLEKECAQRKQGLFLQIEDIIVKIDQAVQTGSKDMADDFAHDRQIEHYGVAGRKYTSRYRAHCRLSPELNEMCTEYDALLPFSPLPFSLPGIVLFSLPGQKHFDPSLRPKPYHKFDTVIVPKDYRQHSSIGPTRGQILDTLPENVRVLHNY